MGLSKVTLRFNKEQEKKLRKLGITAGPDLKRFILEKVEEDSRQSVLIGIIKMILERLEAFEKMSKEMFLETIKRVESVEELVNTERAGVSDVTDTNKLDKIIDIVYEMLKLFILNYTQLYQSDVKKRVLTELEKLKQEKEGY